MRSRVQVLLSACLYYSGLLKLVRWWTLRSRQYLIILNYHRAEGNLHKHLLYLCRAFHVISLETALKELYLSNEDVRQRKDRRPRLVLTFDDGYSDNYTHAFVLAEELQIPMTIFLIPGYMEMGNSFWWADRLLLHAQVDEVTFGGHVYHLGIQEQRRALAVAIDAAMSSTTSTAEKEKILISLRKLLAVPPSLVIKEEPTSLLTWAQVEQMEKSTWISFGAHTMHHPLLANLSDSIEVQREVSESRSIIEQQLEHPVHYFAYPYGKPEQIGRSGIVAVQKAGYDYALTTISGYNTSETNPYLLKRIFTDSQQHRLVIIAKTSGIELIRDKIVSMLHIFDRVKLIRR